MKGAAQEFGVSYPDVQTVFQTAKTVEATREELQKMTRAADDANAMRFAKVDKELMPLTCEPTNHPARFLNGSCDCRIIA